MDRTEKWIAAVWGGLLVLGVVGWNVGWAEEEDRVAEVQIGEATIDEQQIRTHEVRSPYQSGVTKIRVLLPRTGPLEKYFVVYVLPVEAQDEHRYGDGLAEIVKLGLSTPRVGQPFGTVFVAPTFSDLPWYADHSTDRALRQETYFRKVVVPFIEKTYPVHGGCTGRYLLGFSKSGWGAWSMLLRHPDEFQRAAAWDAPLMMDGLGKYGTTPIFGDEENFRRYELTRLLEKLDGTTWLKSRLILTGQGNFQKEHEQMHALLEQRKIPHTYLKGELRQHDWHSGWVADTFDLLFQPTDVLKIEFRPRRTGAVSP